MEEAIAPKIEGADNDFFTDYIKKYGYYDLFLLNPNGFCFYTVTKEADYHTNFVNGKYANSNLGELVRNVLTTKQYGMADFAPYAPSNNEPCGFVAQPVVHDGKVGELVSEISAASTEQAQGIEEVNTAVTEMDKVTQQNAANAEESASAAEEMSAQAEEMKSYVSELVAMVGGKTGHGAAAHTPPARKKAPVLKRPTFRKAKALAAPTKKKGDSPEDVIPMNDEDFADF